LTEEVLDHLLVLKFAEKSSFLIRSLIIYQDLYHFFFYDKTLLV
jgi:hypothetical protein